MEKIKNKQITKEMVEGLEELYNHIYYCDKCGTKYGSNLKEEKPFLCPFCEKE